MRHETGSKAWILPVGFLSIAGDSSTLQPPIHQLNVFRRQKETGGNPQGHGEKMRSTTRTITELRTNWPAEVNECECYIQYHYVACPEVFIQILKKHAERK